MGSTAVSVELYDYLELLARASVTDPAKWPEGVRHGAALLEQIRQMEAQCPRKSNGKLDWDRAADGVEDEYESICSQLTQLIESFNPDQRRYSLDEVPAEHEGTNGSHPRPDEKERSL